MNKKLYIGNLPFTADEAGLKTFFEADGRQVISVKIMMDRETGRSRGFAFVEMGTPEDAQKAIAACHGQEFMGRPLTVNEARDQPPRTGGFGGPRPGGFSGAPSGGGGGLPRPGVFSPPGSGGGGSGGPRPGGFGGGPRSGGFGGGGGGGFTPPVGAPGFDPPADSKGGRANRDRGKEREKDRRKRGKGDDW